MRDLNFVADDSYPIKCYAVSIGKHLSVFRGFLVPLSLGIEQFTRPWSWRHYETSKRHHLFVSRLVFLFQSSTVVYFVTIISGLKINIWKLWFWQHRILSTEISWDKMDDFVIIVNDDQQDFGLLFIPNQLYMFRATSSPIIRSTWLYLQLLTLSTDIAAGWCHGWDGTCQFHLIRDTSRQQYRWTISEVVNTVKCSWWWAKTLPENM